MPGGDRKMIFLEKPQNWQCSFDGSEVIESGSCLNFFWMLPIDGEIEHWGQTYSFTENVAVKAAVVGDSSAFTVDINVSADATVPCARCLSVAPLEIIRNFRYFYRPLAVAASFEDVEDEDLVLVQSLDEEIDISDQVWESLIISLPEKVLCSAECRGICPFCGRVRNKDDCGCSGEAIDPRFEILADRKQEDRDNVPGKGGNQSGNSKK